MKKFRMLMLLSLVLVMVSFVSSCKASGENVLPNSTPNIPAYGDDKKYIIHEAPNQNIDAIDSLPVFINQYPYGQEGIEADVTATLIANLKNNMLSFLQSAGYDTYNVDSLFPDEDLLEQAIFACEVDDLWIVSRPECINVLFNVDVSGINDVKSFCSQLTGDTRIVSAYRYLNIESPEIVYEISNYVGTNNVERITFTIWDKGQEPWDEIYNKSFRYAQVSWDPSEPEAGVLLKIVKIDTDLVYRDYSLLPVDDAKAMLNNETDKLYDVVSSEIVYDGAIMPGYYVPCYNLYVREHPTTNTLSSEECTGFVTHLVPAISFD